MDRFSEIEKVVVHGDMTKLVGGRRYYFAEKFEGSNVSGFWVSEEWKNKHLWDNNFDLKTSK